MQILDGHPYHLYIQETPPPVLEPILPSRNYNTHENIGGNRFLRSHRHSWIVAWKDSFECIKNLGKYMFTNNWITLIIVALFNGIRKEIKVIIHSFCPSLRLFQIVYDLHPYLVMKVPVAQWEIF